MNMDFSFNENQVIFMYKNFKERINLLESQPNYPTKLGLEQDLKFCNSIIEELQRVCPQLLAEFDIIGTQIDY